MRSQTRPEDSDARAQGRQNRQSCLPRDLKEILSKALLGRPLDARMVAFVRAIRHREIAASFATHLAAQFADKISLKNAIVDL
jgi:hypothetical protein